MSRTMGTKTKPFHERVASLKARDNLSKRAGTKVLYEMRPDGLLVPVTTGELRNPFPWRALILTIAFLLGTKTFLLVYFGEDQINERLSFLNEDQALSKAATFFLAPEPVTDWLSSQANELLAK